MDERKVLLDGKGKDERGMTGKVIAAGYRSEYLGRKRLE